MSGSQIPGWREQITVRKPTSIQWGQNIGEQSLDTMLQLVEMGQAIVAKKEG